MELDEEIEEWHDKNHPECTAVWSPMRNPEYQANYQWPAEPTFDNPIVGLVDSGQGQRNDFVLADGTQSEVSNYTYETLLEQWPTMDPDNIGQIKMDIRKEFNIISSWTFYDHDGNEIWNNGH